MMALESQHKRRSRCCTRRVPSKSKRIRCFPSWDPMRQSQSNMECQCCRLPTPQSALPLNPTLCRSCICRPHFCTARNPQRGSLKTQPTHSSLFPSEWRPHRSGPYKKRYRNEGHLDNSHCNLSGNFSSTQLSDIHLHNSLTDRAGSGNKVYTPRAGKSDKTIIICLSTPI